MTTTGWPASASTVSASEVGRKARFRAVAPRVCAGGAPPRSRDVRRRRPSMPLVSSLPSARTAIPRDRRWTHSCESSNSWTCTLARRVHRVVLDGIPRLPGESVREQARYLEREGGRTPPTSPGGAAGRPALLFRRSRDEGRKLQRPRRRDHHGVHGLPDVLRNQPHGYRHRPGRDRPNCASGKHGHCCAGKPGRTLAGARRARTESGREHALRELEPRLRGISRPRSPSDELRPGPLRCRLERRLLRRRRRAAGARVFAAARRGGGAGASRCGAHRVPPAPTCGHGIPSSAIPVRSPSFSSSILRHARATEPTRDGWPRTVTRAPCADARRGPAPPRRWPISTSPARFERAIRCAPPHGSIPASPPPWRTSMYKGTGPHSGSRSRHTPGSLRLGRVIVHRDDPTNPPGGVAPLFVATEKA